MQSKRFWSRTRQNSTKFGQTQKLELNFFCNLPPNFVKGPNKSWLKFHPFCMNESYEKEVRDSFMLKKPFFYQPEAIFLVVCDPSVNEL
jgi:hypothetical protein